MEGRKLRGMDQVVPIAGCRLEKGCGMQESSGEGIKAGSCRYSLSRAREEVRESGVSAACCIAAISATPLLELAAPGRTCFGFRFWHSCGVCYMRCAVAYVLHTLGRAHRPQYNPT